MFSPVMFSPEVLAGPGRVLGVMSSRGDVYQSGLGGRSTINLYGE
jgi:hypothetical protein